MVEGVTNGFKKELEIQGVGYRAAKQGKNLVMNLGYSHQVIVPETDGITIDVPDPLKIVINGIDKQRVGQFAAEVREKRPPEPYKGKGIRYAGEYVAHKEGKAAGKRWTGCSSAHAARCTPPTPAAAYIEGNNVAVAAIGGNVYLMGSVYGTWFVQNAASSAAAAYIDVVDASAARLGHLYDGLGVTQST